MENLFVLKLAIFEISAAIIAGTLILYSTYFILYRFFVRRLNIKNNNIAYAIFAAAILFSVGYLSSGMMVPFHKTMRYLGEEIENMWILLGHFIKYLSLFSIVSITVAVIINLLGINLFMFLTRDVDEMHEIQQNNIAVSIITMAIIIVLTLFVRESVVFLFQIIAPSKAYSIDLL